MPPTKPLDELFALARLEILTPARSVCQTPHFTQFANTWRLNVSKLCSGGLHCQDLVADVMAHLAADMAGYDPEKGPPIAFLRLCAKRRIQCAKPKYRDAAPRKDTMRVWGALTGEAARLGREPTAEEAARIGVSASQLSDWRHQARVSGPTMVSDGAGGERLSDPTDSADTTVVCLEEYIDRKRALAALPHNREMAPRIRETARRDGTSVSERISHLQAHDHLLRRK